MVNLILTSSHPPLVTLSFCLSQPSAVPSSATFPSLYPVNSVKLTRFRSPYGLLPAVFLRYASILSKIHPKSKIQHPKFSYPPFPLLQFLRHPPGSGFFICQSTIQHSASPLPPLHHAGTAKRVGGPFTFPVSPFQFQVSSFRFPVFLHPLLKT